jgi:hypothetical protein
MLPEKLYRKLPVRVSNFKYLVKDLIPRSNLVEKGGKK